MESYRGDMNLKTLLETERVKKYYGKERAGRNNRHCLVKAVDGVTLQIKQGKSMALIGESGSGKTTFGKMAAGLERVSSGRIFFQGKEIQELKERELRPMRKHMQMIFQSSSGVFDPCYTVGESIREVLKNFTDLSDAECDEKVEMILRKVGLDPSLAGRYAGQLSGGQCQRANIARALVLNPQLVVCDEPVSSLDFSIRKQILNLLNEMQEEMDVTYLLITHDLSNVPYICEHVAIMYRGCVVEQMESAASMEREALHPYTNMLFRSVPMKDPDKRKNIRREYTAAPEENSFFEGCVYQKRCKYCMPVWMNSKPALKKIADGHMVACHCYE